MTDDALAAAYRVCAEITRREARNFSYGIRLLPPPKRNALSAIYAMARRIDDIGDGDLPDAAKQDLLKAARADLHRAAEGGDPGDPVLIALMDAAKRLPIPLHAFDELIEGCLADAEGRRYQTAEDLEWYCRCVAGSIGRLSMGVFGTRRVWGRPAPSGGRATEAEVLADHLGIALQLTNILRDIRDDRRVGRIYLPTEDLDRFGCTLGMAGGRLTDPPDRLSALIRHIAQRAERWYTDGLRLLPLLDHRSAACTAAMAGIYHRLLHHIEADPLLVTRGRLSLPGRQKAYVAVRALTLGRV